MERGEKARRSEISYAAVLGWQFLEEEFEANFCVKREEFVANFCVKVKQGDEFVANSSVKSNAGSSKEYFLVKFCVKVKQCVIYLKPPCL